MLPYSPLHHLLLADVGTTLVMTSANVSDEPIAYRDEDALERLAAIADLFLVHDRPIQTRTDDSVVRVAGRRRRECLRRARAATCPAHCRCRAPARAAAARLRRRAEEHLLPRQGRPRVGQPPHRRPRELRDAPLVHRGNRALRAAVRGRAGGRRPRPAPRVPLDQVRARARGASSSSASSTTTPTSPPAWPSTARPGRPSARSSTAPGTASTGRSGAASCCSATCGRFAAWGRCCRSRCPAARARSATVADGVRLARGERSRAAGGLAADRRAGPLWPSVAPDDEHGPSVRRGRCARRHARRGQLRGAGGDRARGGL